jgi:hypothetical protein
MIFQIKTKGHIEEYPVFLLNSNQNALFDMLKQNNQPRSYD